jgi:hypothetical protein
MKRLLAVAVLTLALAGCAKRHGEDKVPEEALDAISAATAAQLNAPVTSIYALLHGMGQNHVISWPDLTIGFDNHALPVNWWLYRHGYVELSGLPAGQGAPFVLAKKALDYDVAGDLPWFTAQAQAPTRVDCTSPAVQPGACEVELPIESGLTSEGTAAGVVAPATATVQATVMLGDDGWIVQNLTPMGTLALHNLALNAILGPENARQSQLAAVNQDLTLKTGAPAPGAAPAAPPAAIAKMNLENGVIPSTPPADELPTTVIPVPPVVDREGRKKL